MKLNLKKCASAAALPLIVMSSFLGAAQNMDGNGCNEKSCNCEIPQAACNSEGCDCYYCYGPSNCAVNAPVRPKTCDGDIGITVSGFYWNAHQDGMEYAIKNQVSLIDPASPSATEALNTLVDARYETPNFKWDWGFKLGLSHSGCHDGWDIGVVWTWYRGRSSGHIEAEQDDNCTLIPLWTDFVHPRSGGITYARDIKEDWKLKLNLIDLELGREFWVSKYLAIRPHVGVRVAFIDQEFDIEHKGGTFSASNGLNGFVDLENDFKGAGVRAGLDSVWHLGCGWGFYGNFAASIVYGRFNVDHDEYVREATGSFEKIKLLETKNSFRASRGMLDLALGVQYSTMFCDCCYALTAMLGWEQHLFFDQNQMWRVVRVGANSGGSIPNNAGQNVFHERRGDLDTQGVTLTLKFEF
ncbi:MAG: hypothetical protein KR126chlam1_00502 [Chlamydiae bacterium]|nr:hypothetical protein [Chlamydiota bacterium]